MTSSSANQPTSSSYAPRDSAKDVHRPSSSDRNEDDDLHENNDDADSEDDEFTGTDDSDESDSDDSQAAHALQQPVSRQRQRTRLASQPDGSGLPRSGHESAVRLVGHRGIVTCVALSDREDWLLSGSTDGEVRLWSVPLGRAISSYVHGRAPIWAVAWSPVVPSMFAAAHADGAVRVWMTSDTTCPVRLFPSFTTSAERLAWHPGGNFLLVGASDGSCRIYDITSAQNVRILLGHSLPITAVAWGPFGDRVATADSSGCVRLWHLPNSECESVVWATGSSDAPSSPTALLFSADEQSLVVASLSSRITVWDVDLLRRLFAERRAELRGRPPLEAAGVVLRPDHSIISADRVVEEAVVAAIALRAASRISSPDSSPSSEPAKSSSTQTTSQLPFACRSVIFTKSSPILSLHSTDQGMLLAGAVFRPPLGLVSSREGQPLSVRRAEMIVRDPRALVQTAMVPMP